MVVRGNFEVRTGLFIYMCWRKVVNKAQIKLKFRCFFLIFIIFFFFCRLGLKCFIYREMVNIKDHNCRACRANKVCSKISHLYIQ